MTGPAEQPHSPSAATTTPAKGSLDQRRLLAICVVAVVLGVFAVMKWVAHDKPHRPLEQRPNVQRGNSEAQPPTRNGTSAANEVLEASLETKDKAIAALESKVRLLEQSLSVLKAQEHSAQVTLAEQLKAKLAADKLLREQEPQINSLKQQVAELTQSLSTTGATLSKEELERVAVQMARQRARFNVTAHRIWRKWFDAAFSEVDQDAARFTSRLEKGVSYTEALAEFSKLKANNDRFIEFADGNAVILANLLVTIETEMWERFMERAITDDTRTTILTTVGEDIGTLNDWDALFQHLPDRGQRPAHEWLKDVIALQRRFVTAHFEDKSNANR